MRSPSTAAPSSSAARSRRSTHSRGSRLAALDASGQVTAWNPSASNTVNSLAVGANAIYVGGQFATIGGVARSRLAAVNTTNGGALSFDPTVNSAVSALGYNGSVLYAGGSFTTVNGATTRNRIAAFSTSTGIADPAFNPNASSTVSALLVSAGGVYAGGSFTTIGGAARNRIAELAYPSGTAASFNPNANGTVSALALQGSTLYAGGSFTNIGGLARNRLAAIDPATSAALAAFNPNASAAVNALTASSSALYAGGSFTTIGGQSRARLAELNLTSGLATSWNPSVNAGSSPTVQALVLSSSALQVGGSFDGVGALGDDELRAHQRLRADPRALARIDRVRRSAHRHRLGLPDGDGAEHGPGVARARLAGPQRASSASQFQTASDSCSLQTLAPTATCAIQVRFAPTSTGPKTAALAIPSNADSSPDSVTLSGAGTQPAASVTPAALTFGAQVAGSSSAAQTLTVENTGTAPLHVGALVLGGADPAQFSLSADGCSSATVAPAASCTVDVRFAPATTGTKSATVTVASDAPTSPDSVSVSGTGVAPAVTASPSSLAFGNQLVGGPSDYRLLRLVNSGTSALHLGSLALAGSDPTQFQLASDTCSSQTLAVGAGCALLVRFAPGSTGAKGASLSIPSDAASSPDGVALSGTGVAPAASLAPPAHAFGSVVVGATSANQIFVLTNTGTAPLLVGTATLVGADPSAFEITADGCASQTVAPSATCSVSVRFAPTVNGARSASLSIPSDAATSPSTAALTGTGVSPAVGLSPTSHAFADQLAGTTSAPHTFTVTNTGSAPLHLGTLSLAGADPSQFAVSSDGCSSATVAPTTSCTVDVSFAPAGPGAKSAGLRVPSDAASSPDEIGLSGVGTAPAVSLDPASQAFGNQLVGGSSAAQTFTARNSGTSDLHIGSVSITGADAGEFSSSADGCSSTTLAPAAYCTVVVGFDPTSTGAKAAALTVSSDATSSPDSAPLTGTGVQPAISLTPPSHAFGSTSLGTPTATQAFVATNTGSAPLHIGAVSLTGADPGDFDVHADGCSETTLGPAATCTVDVRFDPIAGGARSASLRVASDAATSPSTSALTGVGLAPAATITPGPLSFADQLAGTTSAPQTLTVTNSGAATLHLGTVALGGPGAASFALASDGCSGAALAPTETCTVDVTATPAGSGAQVATVAFPSDALTSPDATPVTVTGVAAAIAVDPGSLGFGGVPVLTDGPTQVVTVTNSGTAALHLGTLTLDGDQAAAFTLTSGLCSGATLAPGAACSVAVSFRPPSAGAAAATLRVPSDAPSGTASVPLSGTGTAAALSASPVTQDFDAVPAGGVSPWQTITLVNRGNASAQIGAVALGGGDGGQFATRNDGCSGQVLAASGFCSVEVRFAPSSAGASTAALSFPSSGDPVTVALSGSGFRAQLRYPASVDFGTRPLGSKARQDVVVTNDGNRPVFLGLAETGGSRDFRVIASTCTNRNLAPASSCAIKVRFVTRAAGDRVGQLTLGANATTTPIALTGAGTLPPLSALRSRAGFPSTFTGLRSAPQTVTVINTQPTPLRVTTVKVSSTAFAVGKDGCTGRRLARGQRCALVVRLAPQRVGTLRARLRVSATAITASPYPASTTVRLSGRGRLPDGSVRVGSVWVAPPSPFTLRPVSGVSQSLASAWCNSSRPCSVGARLTLAAAPSIAIASRTTQLRPGERRSLTGALTRAQARQLAPATNPIAGNLRVQTRPGTDRFTFAGRVTVTVTPPSAP